MNQIKDEKDLSIIQEGSACCVILVVDDDPDMRSLLADELGEEGCRIHQAINGVDALTQINICRPNLIITDLNMKFGGFEFLRSLKRAIPLTTLSHEADEWRRVIPTESTPLS